MRVLMHPVRVSSSASRSPFSPRKRGSLFVSVPRVILLAAIVALVIGRAGSAVSETNPVELDDGGAQSQPCQWEFIPDFSLSGEGALVLGNDLSHDAILRRSVEIDWLRRGNLVLSFHWADRTPLEAGPRALENSFEYLGVGYDTPYGRLKGFFRHTCSQAVAQAFGNQMRWSEFGIGFVTEGARLGHFNDGISGDGSRAWLLLPSFDVSVASIGMTSNTEYSFRARGKVREDLYRIGPHVLYAQAGVDSFSGSGSPWGASLELGDRMLLFSKLDLTLFCSFERIPHPNGVGTDAANVVLVGTRLTTRFPESFAADSTTELPDMHVTGSYGTALNDEGSDGDVGLALGVARLGNVSLWGNGAIALQTGGDLVPRYVLYDVGPSLRFEEEQYYVSLDYHYVTRHDTNQAEVDYRRYHSVGFGVSTNGMDVRRWDKERILAEPAEPRRVPLNGNVGAGVFLDQKQFEHNAYIAAGGRWDAVERGRNVLYARLDTRSYLGGSNLFGFRPETGYRRVGRAADFTLYMNYGSNMDPIRWDKDDGRLNVGVRFDY